MRSNVVISGINSNIVTHVIGLAYCVYWNAGGFNNYLSAAVCSAYKSRNFNKLLLVYCKLITYHIKIILVVYSK